MNKIPRILFIHRHANEENGIGGVMEYLHYLPLFLKKQQVESTLYREGEGRGITGPVYFQNGMPVYSGPFLKPAFFTSAGKLSPLVDLCKKESIDLVHAQGTYRSGYLAMRIFKAAGIPYVVTSHSDIIPSSGRMQKNKTLKYCQKILKNAAAVTHLSPPMLALSHRIFATEGKDYLIGNGVDLQDWFSYRAFSSQNYLLALGRLEFEKGFHILIDAYAKLRQRGINTSLVLAGSGSAEAALQARVKEHGLSLLTDFKEANAIPEKTVVFTGYIRGALKKQFIAESKIVLFSTQPALWEEPFGIVQIEAMAAGRPLIASDSKVTRYLQEQGLQVRLVQADSPAAWAEQMDYLLKDEIQQESMARINRENAGRFDWDLIAGQYKQLYLNILRRESSRNSSPTPAVIT